jgi:hypothetical protein
MSWKLKSKLESVKIWELMAAQCRHREHGWDRDTHKYRKYCSKPEKGFCEYKKCPLIKESKNVTKIDSSKHLYPVNGALLA